MIKGVPVSPGVAVARAYRLDEVLVRQDPAVVDAAGLSTEVTRFENACAAVAVELDEVAARVAKEIGEAEASIFHAHRMLLRDPSLVGKVTQRILADNVDAATATRATMDEYAALFARIPDEYLRERMADVRDVGNRILSQLVLQDCPTCLEAEEPVILAAPEILPSQAVMFERLPVVGIATEAGGATGHAAILARSLGIPAVSGLKDLLKSVHTGDMLILDGREGVLHINPGPEAQAAYRKLQREYVDLRDRLVENRDQAAETADGVTVEILANVNNLADAVTAGKVGATGVGLYRTEYLFLTHASVPDEAEQLAAYRAVIEAAPNRAVTLRTLDLGGDKQLPFLGSRREANPFMGWRSIRLAADYPDFFQTQLRAALRAATTGHVELLFPMVSTLEEVRQLKAMIGRARVTLERAGAEFVSEIPVGVMIEVPAAALCVEAILDEVDFVSVGSNDLIQYLMAADRDNPKVSYLCEPFGPAVYRLLNLVIRACVERGKPVTLCGEMAGRPRCFLPLFGMGLRRVSMSPAFVPTVKELVRSLRTGDAEAIAAAVLRMKTFAEIREYLSAQLQRVCPGVAPLDTLDDGATTPG